MFSKTNPPLPQRRPEPTAAPEAGAARRPAPARAASLLGPDLVFEGRIEGEGELHIEGSVKGDIHVARLVIAEQAQVEGVVRGGQVEVRGRIIGNIEAKAVKLYETAHVEGDIVHEQLSIDVGAFFQGRCQQFQRPQSAPAQPQTAQVIELDKQAQG